MGRFACCTSLPVSQRRHCQPGFEDCVSCLHVHPPQLRTLTWENVDGNIDRPHVCVQDVARASGMPMEET